MVFSLKAPEAPLQMLSFQNNAVFFAFSPGVIVPVLCVLVFETLVTLVAKRHVLPKD
jgi:hypothetical protein